jgi:hypothetical protein
MSSEMANDEPTSLRMDFGYPGARAAGATKMADRMRAGTRAIEVTRVRITGQGRRALA